MAVDAAERQPDTQLTLDGREVPHVRRAVHPPYSPAQRAVMQWIARQGSIRSYQAGMILHAARTDEGRCPLRGAVRNGQVGSYQGAACCCFASTDGSALLRRLEERGLVFGRGMGSWGAADVEGWK